MAAAPRQPSNNNAVASEATTTKLVETPADVALRNSIPNTTVDTHTATPVGITVNGLRHPPISSQPTPAPTKKGHAVCAIPDTVKPSA
jgi:hypothetical protein